MMAVSSAPARGSDRTHRSAILHALCALDDHWIGDLIGALSLFASLWALLVIGWALS